MLEELKAKKTFKDDFLFYNPALCYSTQDKHNIKYLREAFLKIGVQKVSFNNLRHTFAYNFLKSGGTIEQLYKQLGDYSIQATMDKYGKIL